MKAHATEPLRDFVEYPVEEMRKRANNFYEMMRCRHTVRAFSDRPVPRDIIETCVRTAGTAPSGANHQPWFFSLISDPQVKRRLRLLAEAEEKAFYDGAAGEEWLEALAPLGTDAEKPHLEIAPWIIAIFGQRRGGVTAGEQRKNYYIPESVGISMGFLIAALHNAGLVTLTHTPKPMAFLNQLCGRPASEKPYLLLIAGYPADNATVPTHALLKKSFGEIAAVI